MITTVICELFTLTKLVNREILLVFPENRGKQPKQLTKEDSYYDKSSS